MTSQFTSTYAKPYSETDQALDYKVIAWFHKKSSHNIFCRRYAEVGAVVGREPTTGTKQLQNPKTGRSYDMVFLTLADHTGSRVWAQLIGKKARECARALDGGGGGGGRVVVALCGVGTVLRV